jgi:hypothetical protein
MLAVVRRGEELEDAAREAVFAPLDRGEGVAPLALQLFLGERRLASPKRSSVRSKVSVVASSVSPKLLRPEKPSMSAASDSTARAKSAALRARVPRSDIELVKLVSPAWSAVSASRPPRNTARSATIGTS